MKNIKHRTRKKVLLIISFCVLICFFSFGVSFAVVYNKYSLDRNALTQVNNGIKVYSSSGQDSTLYNTNRSLAKIEELPEYIKNAFIDTEDKNFYSHNGFDVKRILKASAINLKSGGKAQGASTISQQLIKNALLNNEKSYSRKIKELVLAMKMEKNYSKDEILEMYLNTIYFGSNAYGIENASKTYFNKSAKDLSLNEACCLAGVIKSPAKYSPITHSENLKDRKNFVAKQMYNLKHISKEEYENVLNSPIITSEDSGLDCAYEKEAIYEACNLLGLTERELIKRNYSIYTFKDDNLQKQIELAHNDVLSNIEENNNLDLDSLTVVLDNSGKVVSYYQSSKYNLHNMRRQPASTLKPLAVYLPCVKYNICTPYSMVLDEKINYNGFEPLNADKSFHGYIQVKDALKHSYNIPAVKLLDSVGVNKAISTLNNLGICTVKQDANLSLALGAVSNGITMKDLTVAYSVLANMGISHDMSFIDKILDENGNVIYSYQPFSQQLENAEDCFLINEMLKETAKSGSAKKLNTNLSVASKTGTASNGNGNTDIYNVAYTTQHTILTWVADISNTTLPQNMSSSGEPTKINSHILNALYSNNKPADFEKPNNVEQYAYDMVELQDNHILVKPYSVAERYINYGYFKTDNCPVENTFENDSQFNTTLTKFGANISFVAHKNKNYKLIRFANGAENELLNIKENSGKIDFIDKDVFYFNELTYRLTNNENKILGEIKLRPKDYLITEINNMATQNKKKWYV